VQLTTAQYEELVGADILRRQLRDKLGAAIPRVQPAAYIQLIVAPTDQSNNVQQQLKDGVPFETVARRFSQDQDVETNGGEIGWVPRLAYPELDRALFGWKEGETQHVIESADGWWVVRVVERLDNAARMEGIRLATENEADSILRRVKAGESFQDLAAQFSTDAATRDLRGDLGVVKAGERGKDFDEAIRGLEAGTLIGPAPTHEFVYFAIVKERSSAQEIPPRFFEVLKQRALEDWLNKERAANNIDYCPGSPDNCFGSVKVDRALAEIASISLTRAQEATATATVRQRAGGQPAF
jgi:parvulin-like peptidyl-prolyl isomerase